MEKQRKIVVELETPDGQLARFDGLNVKFSVKKTANAVMNKATIDIANLSLDRIFDLTTFASPYLNARKRKRINLYAGYTDSGADDSVPLIFSGEITKAQPTMPPDIWLNCEARTGFYNNQRVVSMGVNGKISVKELCGKVAESIGLSLDFTSTGNKTVEGFSHNGGATQALNKVNDLGGVIAFEDDGVLRVMDSARPVTSEYVRVLNRHSGMIGIPQIDHMGIKVKMLLDPAFRVGDRVQVESELIPKANGVYWCYALSHSGTLRGTDFYTEIEARRMDIL